MPKKLSPLALIWLLNLALFLSYAVGFPGVSFLKSSVLEYKDVKSDPFDGAVSPIAYVPDWTKPANTNKAKKFEDFSLSDFVEIPEYNLAILSDDTQKNLSSILTRYTYITLYMGSYRGNYTEYDGSHGAVDIRAPIGTPILAIANAVVVKVKNTETGDGKYVVLRHDDVEVSGQKETYYSVYEHLSEIDVTEGVKVRRGDVIGKVGMTGITTTPHLHFQIDKSTSPFHPFWPYSFREASDLGLDFFAAINVGLGKENMIRHTIHPMEFIKNHRFYASAPPEKTVAIATTTVSPAEPIVVSSQLVADASDTVAKPADTSTVVVSSPVEDANVQEVKTPVATRTIDPARPFSDIGANSPFFLATKYLADKGVTRGYDDGWFRPSALLSRSEAILLYARLFNISPLENAEWEYSDVLPSDEVYKYLARASNDGIISKNTLFRPNDSLTRAEAVTLLMRTSKLPISSEKASKFKDVKLSSAHMPYINTFASYLKLGGTSFYPDKDITRGELAKILYTFDQKNKK